MFKQGQSLIGVRVDSLRENGPLENLKPKHFYELGTPYRFFLFSVCKQLAFTFPAVYKRVMTETLQELIPDDWIDPAEYVPAELQLDDDHPDRDDFAQALREIDQKIFAFARQMKPKHREFARLVRTGMSPKDLAKKMDVTTKTVYTWAQREDVKRQIILVDYQQRKIDGADINHRKGVLWRIAMDQEETRPNIAIQAIQEINKMSGTYTPEGGNSGNVVNISINGELLPKTGLDTLPDTYEGRFKEIQE